MEEFFLGLILTLQKLNVVDQQEIDIAIAALELGVLTVLDGLDKLVGEGLGGDVNHLEGVQIPVGSIAYGLDQVGLAEAHPAVDQTGIVGGTGILGDRYGRVGGEGVVLADNEVLEGIVTSQVGVFTGGRFSDAGMSGIGRSGGGSCRRRGFFFPPAEVL